MGKRPNPRPVLKRRIISLLLICCCISFIAFADEPTNGTIPYHNPEFGYTIETPSDWVEIPQHVLREASDSVFSDSSHVAFTTMVGFQPATHEYWLEYPYVLFYTMPYKDFGINRQINESEFAEIAAAITGVDIHQVSESNLKQGAIETSDQLSINQPQLDVSNRRLFVTMEMTVEGIGDLRSLTVGYFGRESMVQVMFYALKSEWDQHTTIRQSIYESFSYNADKAYNPQLATIKPDPFRNPEMLADLVAKFFLAILFIGGGIVAIVVMIQKSKQSTR